MKIILFIGICFLMVCFLMACSSYRLNKDDIQHGDNLAIEMDGTRWFASGNLTEIAKHYIQNSDVKFNCDDASNSVWINSGNGEILAQILFYKGIGEPACTVLIDRQGRIKDIHLGYGIDGKHCSTNGIIKI